MFKLHCQIDYTLGGVEQNPYSIGNLSSSQLYIRLVRCHICRKIASLRKEEVDLTLHTVLMSPFRRHSPAYLPCLFSVPWSCNMTRIYGTKTAVKMAKLGTQNCFTVQQSCTRRASYGINSSRLVVCAFRFHHPTCSLSAVHCTHTHTRARPPRRGSAALPRGPSEGMAG